MQNHFDRLDNRGLSWINSITMPDTRQSFGGPHQLYLLRYEIESNRRIYVFYMKLNSPKGYNYQSQEKSPFLPFIGIAFVSIWGSKYIIDIFPSFWQICNTKTVNNFGNEHTFFILCAVNDSQYTEILNKTIKNVLEDSNSP